MRLSTDIDIIVSPKTDIDFYIAEASKNFPFKRVEEQKRIGKNNIVKRHFKFFYESPVTNKEFHIILDIVFEENHYSKLISKEINNNLLSIIEPRVFVDIPNINSILGDKLTAFAPHTTGILYGQNKEMEIIKQMFDVATLIEEFDNIQEVKETYYEIVDTEIAYRGLTKTPLEVLMDTYNTAMCIVGKSRINKENYTMLLDGMRRIRSHIYSEKFTPENAPFKAVRIMYFVACIIKDVEFKKIDNPNKYADERFEAETFKYLKYLRKIDLESYGYLVETHKLMN
jgi:hypothetical protein